MQNRRTRPAQATEGSLKHPPYHQKHMAMREGAGANRHQIDIATRPISHHRANKKTVSGVRGPGP